MGQKVNPVGMRIGVNRDWDSTWFAEKDFSKYLHEDIKIRKYLEKELADAVVGRIEIKRLKEKLSVTAYVVKPGVVKGQDDTRVNAIVKKLTRLSPKSKISFTVAEVENPDLDATCVAKSIAQQLEQRASFRVAQKKAIQRVMKAGAKGIKTCVGGRLGGADIARSEGYSEGVVPLHTLRADIDFAVAEAMTTYGLLGVKVWICKGEILPQKKNRPQTETKGE